MKRKISTNGKVFYRIIKVNGEEYGQIWKYNENGVPCYCLALGTAEKLYNRLKKISLEERAKILN
jgi:hypothetical protein